MTIGMSPAADRASHWALLGAVRFGLALIVLAQHTANMPDDNRVTATVRQFGAFSAVLGFLVLSGYSIAQSLARGSAGFYRRRFQRIYPLYFLSVVAGLVPFAAGHQLRWLHVTRAAANLAFLQTFLTGPVSGNPVVWSLAVEVAFYAAAPLLHRLSSGWLFVVATGSAVAYASMPRFHLPYFTEQRHGLATLLLGWAWLGGFLFHRVRDWWPAGVALVALPLVVTWVNPTLTGERFARPTLAACLLAVAAGRSVRLPAVGRRAAAFLGDMSYPLYLVQAPLVITYLVAYHGRSPWFVVGWSMAATLAAMAVDAALRRPVARLTDAVADRGTAAARAAWDWTGGDAISAVTGRAVGWGCGRLSGGVRVGLAAAMAVVAIGPLIRRFAPGE